MATDNPGSQPPIPGMESWVEPPYQAPPSSTPPDTPPPGRDSPDLTEIIKQQVQATEKLLTSLDTHLNSVINKADEFGDSFKSTADHIRRSAEATEQLANQTKKAADQSEKFKKNTNDGKSSILQMVQALARGDLGGAIGEAFQGIPKTEGIREGLTTRGGALKEAGIARGGLTGLGMRGIGSLLGGGAGLLTPAGIYGAYRLFNYGTQQYQDTRQLGTLTGEGTGAGIAAGGINLPIIGRIGGEVGALRGSPFDLVGNREAMEIVQGVRGAGFRGGEARNTEEAIAGMINDLGIGVQDAMNIAIPSIKEAGMSTGQLQVAMSDLDDQAKASHASISELTKTLGDLVQQTAQVSRPAARLVPEQRAAMLNQFKGTWIARTPGVFSTLMGTQNRQALAMMHGFAPEQIADPRFFTQINRFYTESMAYIAAGNKSHMPWEVYAAWVLDNQLWAQLFTGMTPAQVAEILKQYDRLTHHNTTTQKYLQEQTSRNKSQHASRATQSISDNFRSLMKRKQSIVDGPLGDLITGDSGGVDRSLIRREGMKAERRVADVLMQLGLTKEERRQILDPIIMASKWGDKGQTEKALDAADKAIQQYQKEGRIHVHTTVGFDPRSARMLKTLNIGQIQALRGERGTQGVELHQ